MLTIKCEKIFDEPMNREVELISDSPVLTVSNMLPVATVNGNANQASCDSQLFSTLCEIDKNNYMYLFERCKAHNINGRQLRFLEKEHLRRIIPQDQVGIMAEFEHLHTAWRAQFQPQLQQQSQTPTHSSVVALSSTLPGIARISMAEPAVTTGPILTSIENMETEAATTSNKLVKQKAECKKQGKNRNSKEYSLDEIIKHDMRKIREQYKINGILNERDRRRLATALAEYFKRNNIYMSKDIMENLAVQISTVFPTESKLAWHEYVGRQRRGHLTLKLYNTPHARTVRKDSKCSEHKEGTEDRLNNKNMDTDETAQEESSIRVDGEEAERLQNWLRNNKCEDNDELTQMWYETSSYRSRYLRKHIKPGGEHLVDVLENWPAYKQPIGHLLIRIDFNTLYPHSENVFYQRWPLFLNKIQKLYKLEVRLDLYDRFCKNEASLSQETKQMILIQLLHVVVRPARSISPKQMAQLYTISESQNAFIKFFLHQKEMDEYTAPQPMIFIKGAIFDVEKVFVAFKDVRYEMKIMDALFTCLQIFLFFKIDFPLPCLNFWSFVQKYFADIKPESDINLAIVEHIIKFLLP